MKIAEIHDATAEFKLIPPIEVPDDFVMRSLEHALAMHSAISNGDPQLAGTIEGCLVTATQGDGEPEHPPLQPHDRALLLSRAMYLNPRVEVTAIKYCSIPGNNIVQLAGKLMCAD